MKTFEEVTSEFGIPKSHFLLYLQTSSHLWSKTWDLVKAFWRSSVDMLISQGTYAMKDIYPCPGNIFIASKPVKPGAFWTKEFPDLDLPKKILMGHLKLMKHVMNEAWRETQYKILHKAYIPFLIILDKPDTVLCTKRDAPKPSLFHKLYECPAVSLF